MPSLALNAWGTVRSQQLDELAAAHAAVGGRQRQVLGGRNPVGLHEARAFRSACEHLAVTFDDVLATHLEAILGVEPW
ncbi:MAG: hypothetical protein ACYCUM_11330 [Solirubrobacteraceae bacterium]